jgi:hypothetical protein
MKTQVEFRAKKFPPYKEEEELINPGRYGKKLAEYWVKMLSKEGYKPGELIAEDWGWKVPVGNPSFSLWVGCGNYDEYSDGFLCFIEPNKPYIRKWFTKVDASEIIGKLQVAMNKILAADKEIKNVRWWTHEEFNNIQK